MFGGCDVECIDFLFPPHDDNLLLKCRTSAAEWDTVMNNSMFCGYKSGNLLLVYLMPIILLKVFQLSSATSECGWLVVSLRLRFYLGCIAWFQPFLSF